MICGFRPLGLALSFFVVLGALLFIAGLLLLYFLPQEQLDQVIQQYNRVSQDWDHEHREQFSSYQFRVNTTKPGELKLFDFVADSVADEFRDNYKYLRHYTPLKYLLQDPFTFSTQQFSNIARFHFILQYKVRDNVHTLLHSHEKAHMQFILAENVCLSPMRYIAPSASVPLFLTRPFDDRECSFGVWINGECTLLYQLKSVCFKVRVNGTHAAFDYTYGGYGCEITDFYFDTQLPVWAAAKYSIFIPSSNSTLNQSASFHDFKLLVRSNNDPYVFAEYVTNGTLNFSSYEERSGMIEITRQYVIFGSIASGGAICIISLVLLLLCGLTSKTRDLLVEQMPEEHTYLLNREKPRQNTNWNTLLFPKSIAEN